MVSSSKGRSRAPEISSTVPLSKTKASDVKSDVAANRHTVYGMELLTAVCVLREQAIADGSVASGR